MFDNGILAIPLLQRSRKEIHIKQLSYGKRMASELSNFLSGPQYVDLLR